MPRDPVPEGGVFILRRAADVRPEPIAVWPTGSPHKFDGLVRPRPLRQNARFVPPVTLGFLDSPYECHPRNMRATLSIVKHARLHFGLT